MALAPCRHYFITKQKNMKKLLILILIALTFSSCSKQEEEKITKYFKTATVGTGIVNETENFIGYTKGINQVMLATKAPWRITYMSKKVWDKVYTWELLASLWNEEAKNWYNTASNIVNKLLNLKKNTAKALDEQIKSMQAKIKSIEAQVSWVSTWLEDTKNITEKQLQTAKTGLETAKANLEQTKKELESKKKSILTWAETALSYMAMISTNIMDFDENLLWMDPSNDDFNDKIDDYLGMKDSNQLHNTENLYKKILPEYKEFKTFYETKIQNQNPSEETLVEWLNKAKVLWEKLNDLLDETYKVLDNSIENVYFPFSMINDLKKQTTELWDKLEQTMLTTEWWQMLWVKWSLENLQNFESAKQKAITLLEKQVELAQKQVAQYEAMASWQVNDVSTKKQVASLWLEEAKAGLQALIAKKEASLREIDAKIAEAIWKQNEASVMIANWNIIAPFSWIITNKMMQEDQVINAWMPIYELADTSAIKIKLQVPENIKNNLSLWDKIDVSLDWETKVYTWKVSLIAKSANPLNKKYEIEIVIPNKKWEISVWKMAIVSFNSDFKQESNSWALRIPNSAIIEKFMLPWVYILDWKKAKFKNIKILKMWEYYSQISWLNPWDKVITDWKENIYDWEVLR